MESDEDWSVPNSDDERDEGLTCISDVGPLNNACRFQDLPVKVLRYYEEIDRNKVLELSVKEFRVPCQEEDVDDDVCRENFDSEGKGDGEENQADSLNDREQDTDLEKSNEPSAFDYLDEAEECQGQLPRRTPKSGRLPKKRIGTLKNVISNLKRYKELDSSSNDDPKAISIEERDVEENKDHTEDKDYALESANM